MGQIVARNLMVEVQTDPAPPSLGSQEGDIDNGGRRWHWTREVKATDDKRLLQVDLIVDGQAGSSPVVLRSEEHTSELQSLMRISYALFCLKITNKHKQSMHNLSDELT